MGLFGGLSPGGSGWDKIALLGAALKDASSGGSDNLMDVQKMLAGRQKQAQQQAFLQDLNNQLQPQYQDGPSPQVKAPGLIGGQAATLPTSIGDVAMPPQPASPAMSDAPAPYAYQPPVRTSNGLNINDPRMGGIALKAQALGVPITSLLEVMKAQQPNVSYDRGFGFNQKTGEAMGAFHPNLDNGQTLGPDGGVMNLPGAVQSASAMAGGVAGAQEAAKAGLDIVPVQLPDGSTQQMTRAQAAALFGGRAGVASPQQGTAFGRSQTPQAKAFEETQAKGMADRGLNQPKAEATITDADRVTDFSRGTIHDILGETQDPNTGQWVKTKPSQVNWATSGVLGATKDLPGSPAHNLKAKLDTILAQTSMGELQKMRDESPTGGALGRVTQQEINLLAAMRGSIEQTQSGTQLEASLRHHLEQLDRLSNIRQQMYAEQYSGAQPKGASPKASSGRLAAPQPGAIVKGYRFMGGDPSSPKSWVKN